MSSMDYYINLLKSDFIRSIDIPAYIITYPQMLQVIRDYNWIIFPSSFPGWNTCVRHFSRYD
jgi:hypothetical protein